MRHYKKLVWKWVHVSEVSGMLQNILTANLTLSRNGFLSIGTQYHESQFESARKNNRKLLK